MIQILSIYRESFCANVFSRTHFRMIGLIDARIKFDYGIERVTLAYFRSSGTNSGKIKGLWYPIVGIKTVSGGFTEFTEFLNDILTRTTKSGTADAGWLAKSLFFPRRYANSSMIRGFSSGKHYEALLEIGMILREMYEKNRFRYDKNLTAEVLNSVVMSTRVYPGNKRTQRENYHTLMGDIFYEQERFYS
ncbi:MAG TPA: hypothetical protein PLD48_08035 [Bacillota bacterium]|nr:hypothetical protein [Bacillota bacterium]HOK69712.1 hypothetical protein [Bacillota bacterium]HPP85578.1 hypothetical protein [Bacillota bacterium]